MGNEVIFYTQLASIVAFVVSLFAIYRALVSNKDSLIELQKEKISSLKERISELEEQSPDALAESLSKRVELQLSEIDRLNKENADSDTDSKNEVKEATQTIVDAVAKEIKEWKDEINRKRIHKWAGSTYKRRNVSGYLGSKTERKYLYSKFIKKGGTSNQWARIAV